MFPSLFAHILLKINKINSQLFKLVTNTQTSWENE